MWRNNHAVQVGADQQNQERLS